MGTTGKHYKAMGISVDSGYRVSSACLHIEVHGNGGWIQTHRVAR